MGTERCEHGRDPRACRFSACSRKRMAPVLARERRNNEARIVDMTSVVVRGATVIRRATSLNRCARWLVEYACGHRGYALGVNLREAAKRDTVPLKCPECRTKGRK